MHCIRTDFETIRRFIKIIIAATTPNRRSYFTPSENEIHSSRADSRNVTTENKRMAETIFLTETTGLKSDFSGAVRLLSLGSSIYFSLIVFTVLLSMLLTNF